MYICVRDDIAGVRLKLVSSIHELYASCSYPLLNSQSICVWFCNGDKISLELCYKIDAQIYSIMPLMWASKDRSGGKTSE